MSRAVLLPGILMPGGLRYAALLEELGGAGAPVVKDLEIYSGGTVPPHGYTLETELDGIDRVIDELGEDAVHLYGHSAGGACALAYTARRPERVLSLALDEPATDFSPQDLAYIEANHGQGDSSDGPASIGDFVATLFRTGVTPPPAPQGPPPDWMTDRPAGIRAFREALLGADVDRDALCRFEGRVYYSYGTLSHERWEAMSARLGTCFGDFVAEAYDGLSHMNTSHVAEPGRVAARLRGHWNLERAG